MAIEKLLQEQIQEQIKNDTVEAAVQHIQALINIGDLENSRGVMIVLDFLSKENTVTIKQCAKIKNDLTKKYSHDYVYLLSEGLRLLGVKREPGNNVYDIARRIVKK
jgi:hypothetical protein